MISESLKLMDIQGLDSVSIFPLATIWWLLLLALLMGALLLLGLMLYLHKKPMHWRKQLTRQLQSIELKKAQQTPKETAGELSLLLRHMALFTSDRETVAGITGDDWLRWLEIHDPDHFGWLGEGQLLLNLPYAPETTVADALQLDKLLAATRQFITQVKA